MQPQVVVLRERTLDVSVLCIGTHDDGQGRGELQQGAVPFGQRDGCAEPGEVCWRQRIPTRERMHRRSEVKDDASAWNALHPIPVTRADVGWNEDQPRCIAQSNVLEHRRRPAGHDDHGRVVRLGKQLGRDPRPQEAGAADQHVG